MSESCSDINLYCDNEFVGLDNQIKKCKQMYVSVDNFVNVDPKLMSDQEKKIIVNIDKMISSKQKIKNQISPSAKISCIKKLVLCDYYFSLLFILGSTSVARLNKQPTDEELQKFSKTKAFFTAMSDTDAIAFINDPINKGYLHPIIYATKYVKNPNYNAPILPSKFDRSAFIDLFDAYGL